jgi:trehalose-6-phosphatase
LIQQINNKIRQRGLEHIDEILDEMDNDNEVFAGNDNNDEDEFD